MKTKTIFLCIMLISIGIASAISLPYYPTALPDGNTTVDAQLKLGSGGFVVIDGLKSYLANENLNVNNLYFKAAVPNDNDDEWNLSQSFMERKPTVIFFPSPLNNPSSLDYWIASQQVLVYACCDITKGDLLYTANASNPDGSFNITLAGTLTNNYGQNWKSRVYNSTSSSWGNVNIGASVNVDIYNRRAKLHSDGTLVGYAMESVNVSSPVLIKIYKI